MPDVRSLVMVAFADHGSPQTIDLHDQLRRPRRRTSASSVRVAGEVRLSSRSLAGTETTSIQLMSNTIAARLDRLPISRTIFKMVTLISLGGFFEFYDIFLTAYIAPGLYKSGMFSPVSSNVFGSDNIATFIAVFFAGLFVGGGLGPFYSSRSRRAGSTSKARRTGPATERQPVIRTVTPTAARTEGSCADA